MKLKQFKVWKRCFIILRRSARLFLTALIVLPVSVASKIADSEDAQMI